MLGEVHPVETTTASFLDEYDSHDTQATDPATIARAKALTLQRWLAERPAEVFAELRARRPILSAPGITVVTTYADVMEVLERNQVFTVRPYAPKMERIGGPFILGLDDSPQYQRDVSILRTAVRREDLPAIQRFVAERTREILRGLLPTGRIELVETLTRVVPALTVGQYFGTPGPDVPTLQRWARTIFFDIFANLRDEAPIREAALASGAEIRAYLDELVARRRGELDAGQNGQDDILTRLLKMQCNPASSFSNLEIRNNFIGLIIGAIDTNSKAIVNVIDELLRRPEQLAAAQQAARSGDDELLGKYVAEALRFRPQNSFLVRLCEQPYSIARGTTRETAVRPGTLVFVANSSAMLDADVLDDPAAFRLDRPAFDYFHFGSGLHTCFGQYISRVQIREVVKQVLLLPGLRRAAGAAGQVQMTGIFPASFTVEFNTQEDDMDNNTTDLGDGRGVHSIITAIVPILPGHLEPLRQTLQALGDPSRTSPIKAISTIHFARWVIIDNGERLLFTSNFDGTWDSYIDEFIDKASGGLDAIWQHCVDFPEGGSKNREAFKAYVRKYQTKAELFYCAYDDLTVKDILKAQRIREKFEGLLDEFSS